MVVFTPKEIGLEVPMTFSCSLPMLAEVTPGLVAGVTPGLTLAGVADEFLLFAVDHCGRQPSIDSDW